MRPMRVAWFSPLPPVRSGIAAYSAELLPLLGGGFEVDVFVDRRVSRVDRRASPTATCEAQDATAFDAHDFVWMHQRRPYDLIVYQLGNAPCHDYMWAYLVRYPGLVVLHDACLHHARARHLLEQQRFGEAHPHDPVQMTAQGHDEDEAGQEEEEAAHRCATDAPMVSLVSIWTASRLHAGATLATFFHEKFVDTASGHAVGSVSCRSATATAAPPKSTVSRRSTACCSSAARSFLLSYSYSSLPTEVRAEGMCPGS